MILLDAKVRLRPLEFSDAAELLPAFSDDANMRYWSRAPITTLDDLRDYMKWNVTETAVECYAITVPDDDKALGWIALIDKKMGPLSLDLFCVPTPKAKDSPAVLCA